MGACGPFSADATLSAQREARQLTESSMMTCICCTRRNIKKMNLLSRHNLLTTQVTKSSMRAWQGSLPTVSVGGVRVSGSAGDRNMGPDGSVVFLPAFEMEEHARFP